MLGSTRSLIITGNAAECLKTSSDVFVTSGYVKWLLSGDGDSCSSKSPVHNLVKSSDDRGWQSDRLNGLLMKHARLARGEEMMRRAVAGTRPPDSESNTCPTESGSDGDDETGWPVVASVALIGAVSVSHSVESFVLL